MDEIHDWRDQSSADVCVLVINDTSDCGLATNIPALEDFQAFAVVHYDCATGNYSFGHEIGHLQGARHHYEEDQNEDPFLYGHGFAYAPGNWRTIMATDGPHTKPCFGSCDRLQYWSNPDVFYNGVAMGDPDTSDNAKALNQTASGISSFRSPPPPPPVPQNFTITNAMSIGQNPHMTWDPSSGATSYNVYRSPGGQTSWTNIDNTTSTSYTDNLITITKPSDPDAVEFFYRVTAVNDNGESAPSNSESIWGEGLYKPSEAPILTAFKLDQNYPNPFNPETTITYELPSTVNVKVQIFDLLGKEIRTLVNQVQGSGVHQISWNGKDNNGHVIPSGIYLLKIEAGRFVEVRKMTLLR